MNILLCVVLYNRRPAYSETLLSLSRLFSSGGARNTTIYVWNNGPKKISVLDLEWLQKSFKRVNFRLVETLNNDSLAHIYNSITELKEFDRFAFLDHDSVVQANYIDAICSPDEFDVLTPKIMGAIRQISPKYKGEVVTDDLFLVNFSGRLRAITSGLVISKHLVSIFEYEFGSVFDEKYVLYGVDTSFFLRLDLCARKKTMAIVVKGAIYHSLSRLEKEAYSVKTFRKRERGLDLGITLRNYFCSSSLLTLVRESVKTIFLKQTISWRYLVKGALLGKHPRSNV